jgi:DNA-binding PadR family transcriptional regulator
MFRDRTVIPTEAIRLCALALLAEHPRSYGELAAAFRNIADRVMGPSLDVFGTPIQLMEAEGLVRRELGPSEGAAPLVDAMLTITDRGRTELKHLLTAPLRGRFDELNRLTWALKLRFLDLLDPAERRAQVEALIEVTTGELDRVRDLRDQGPGELLSDWLAQEVAQLEARNAWLKALKARLDDGSSRGKTGPYHIPSHDHGNYGQVRALIARLMKQARSTLDIADPGADIVRMSFVEALAPAAGIAMRVLVGNRARSAAQTAAQRYRAQGRRIEIRSSADVSAHLLLIDGSEAWRIDAAPGGAREPAFTLSDLAAEPTAGRKAFGDFAAAWASATPV